jgi:hypothetical protein
MTVQHKNLTGSDLHEPKGISSAGTGTAYFADGAGSGNWVDPGGSVYGETIVTNNSTTQNMTIATDTTLNTDSDYVKVDSGVWTAGLNDGVTFNTSNDYLEIATSGVYVLSFWASFVNDTNLSVTAFKYSTDNTNATLSTRKVSRKTGTGGDVGSITAVGHAQLNAGDKVSMFVAADKTCVITLQDAGLTLILLKAD